MKTYWSKQGIVARLQLGCKLCQSEVEWDIKQVCIFSPPRNSIVKICVNKSLLLSSQGGLPQKQPYLNED